MFFDVGVRKYPARLHKRICQKATFGSLTTGLYAKFCTIAINNMSKWRSDSSYFGVYFPAWVMSWLLLFLQYIQLFIQALHTAQTKGVTHQPAFI